MIKIPSLNKLSLSRNLLSILFVLVCLDFFTRLIILSPSVNKPDLENMASLNEIGVLLSLDQATNIENLLNEFKPKPKTIEVTPEPQEKVIKSPSLSEQGGKQKDLYVGNYKFNLVAIVSEVDIKRFAVLKRISLLDDTTKLEKVSDGDTLEDLLISIESMYSIKFASDKLMSDIYMYMYEKNE